jgi:hypothetical protein
LRTTSHQARVVMTFAELVSGCRMGLSMVIVET